MNNYSKHVKELIKLFRASRNIKIGDQQSRYMRSQFQFIGIKQPERKELLKSFGKEKIDLFTDNEILEIYKLPEREFKYIAIEMTKLSIKKERKLKTIQSDKIKLYESMISIDPHWDTIDIISTQLIGVHFLLFPDLVNEYTGKWINDQTSFWNRRICLIFQLLYKKDEIDLDLLYSFILKTINEDEFFIQKAIGWSLRQASKTAHKSNISKFIELHKSQLSKLSYREATKYL